MTDIVYNKNGVPFDVDAIATDLNGKMDVDTINASDTGKSNMAGYGMPSNTYTDLTLGASGTTYTAPANGWFLCACTGNVGQVFFELVNGGLTCATASYTGGWARASIPVKKGDTVWVYYGGTNFTKQLFRFTYAEGSKGEA